MAQVTYRARISLRLFFPLLTFSPFWDLACTLMVSIEQVTVIMVILSGVVFTDSYCQFILGLLGVKKWLITFLFY